MIFSCIKAMECIRKLLMVTSNLCNTYGAFGWKEENKKESKN